MSVRTATIWRRMESAVVSDGEGETKKVTLWDKKDSIGQRFRDENFQIFCRNFFEV